MKLNLKNNPVYEEAGGGYEFDRVDISEGIHGMKSISSKPRR